MRSAALRGVVVEEHDGRAFFLDGIEPASVGMEVKMARAVPRWQRRRTADRWASEHRVAVIELPDEDLIEAQIAWRTNVPEGSAWIMWAWVRSCPLMAKLPGGAFVGLPRTDGAGIVFDVARSPSRPSGRIGSTATEPPK